jgi:hypothetical protein
MAMTSASEFSVFGAAARIVLNGDTRPVVDGVGEAVVAGLSSDDDAAPSGPLGHGRDSCQTAQRGVIASLQGIPGFCEQRGEDGPSHSGKDARISASCCFFCPGSASSAGVRRGGQAVDPAMGVFDLTVEQADARDEQSDMGARGFDCSGGDAHRRPAQRVDHESGVEAADAMAFEQLGDRRLAQTARRVEPDRAVAARDSEVSGQPM